MTSSKESAGHLLIPSYFYAHCTGALPNQDGESSLHREVEERNAEVVGKFGGPCRGRTYGPLIKSSDGPKPEPTQQDLNQQKNGDSEKPSS